MSIFFFRQKTTLLLILYLLSHAAFSQTEETAPTVNEKKVHATIGLRLGPSAYTMFGNEVDLRTKRGASINRRIGIEVGVDARFTFHKNFYSSVGLSYLRKGGHLKGGGWVTQSPVKYNYLMTPVVLGITSGRTAIPINMAAEIGWAYCFLLSSENAYSEDIAPGYYVKENKNTGALVYGLEISTDAIKRITLFMNYRGTRDLNFFHTRRNDQTNEDYDLWNRGYSVTFGVRFKRKTKSVQPENKAKQFSDTLERAFSWGLKGGLNFNNTFYANLPSGAQDESMTQLSPHLGLFFAIKLGKKLSLIPEVQYIQKGYNFKNDQNTLMRLQLEYLDFPFMLSYKVSQKINIEAGPVAGIFIDGKSKGEGSTQQDWYYHEIFEYGLNGGLRLQVSEKWSVAGRYYCGMKNISNLFMDENRNSGKVTEEFNTNVQFSGYFRF